MTRRHRPDAGLRHGGGTPPNMPTIDAVAQSGLRFRNTWSMPECSPGPCRDVCRRYPLRTNIYQAIGENDLPTPAHTRRHDHPQSRSKGGLKAACSANSIWPDQKTTRPATVRRRSWAGTTSMAGGRSAGIDRHHRRGRRGTRRQLSLGFVPPASRAGRMPVPVTSPTRPASRWWPRHWQDAAAKQCRHAAAFCAECRLPATRRRHR